MHAIVLALSRQPSVLNQVLSNLTSVGLEQLQFNVARQSTWRTKGLLLFSAEAQNPIFSSGSFTADETSAFAFGGVPVIADLGERKGSYDASDIADFYLRNGPAHFRANTASSYCVVHARANGDAFAFSDICSRTPLFYRETPDLILVSTNPRIIALAGTQRIDWSFVRTPTLSLCAHGQIWGSEVLYSGVHLLPTGQALHLQDGRLLFRDIDPIWRQPGGATPPSFKAYEDASHSLLRSFQTLGRLLPTRVLLGLSGGKDSRVMAAYASAAGIIDKVGFYTGGIQGSPEFDIADMVRERLNVPNDNRITTPAQVVPELYLERLRNQVGRHDAMLLPTAGFAHSHRGNPQIEIGGVGGELYRRGIAKQFVRNPIQSVEDARQRWNSYHVNPDPNKILKNDALSNFKTWMSEWVQQKIDEFYDVQALPELFFTTFRVPLHQGIANASSGIRLPIDLLINPKIMSTHFSIGTFAGANELTHAALLWLIKPELCAVPFMKDKWSPELRPHFPDGALADEPYGAKMNDTTIRPISFDFFSEKKDFVKNEFFATDRNDEIFEFIDRSLLLERLEAINGSLSTQHAVQMFSVLGLQMRANGNVEFPKDGQTAKPVLQQWNCEASK